MAFNWSKPPARQQEVNIPALKQQARRLEYDDGMVGKAEIAGSPTTKRAESGRR
jgi:hypothetical protein